MEPFTTELLCGAIRSVGPFNGDTIIVGIFFSKFEGVAGDSHESSFFRIKDTARRFNTEALHVGSLDSPSDTTTASIDDLKNEEMLVEERKEDKKNVP